MTKADKQLGIDLCNRFPIDLADVQGIIDMVREAVAPDAARYRWLRDRSIGQYEHPIVVSQKRVDQGMQYIGPLCGEELDKRIDAARDESREKT